MPHLIERPTRIDAAGEPAKTIEEFVGRLRTGETRVSIARMDSPPGWSEPGQVGSFDEYTFVISGELVIEHEGGRLVARAGQAVCASAGEWVRYSTPNGATYLAVCLPAFGPALVCRDGA